MSTLRKLPSEEWFQHIASRIPPNMPNSGPHRCGGLDEAFLRRMAGSHKPPLGDPRVARVLGCPRCRWMLYEMRREKPLKKSFLQQPLYAFGLVFAVMLLIAGTVWTTRSQWQSRPQMALITRTIDLSTSAYTRGGGTEARLASLPRSKAMLTLVLPALSEAGEYTVGLSETGKSGRALLMATGKAVEQDQRTLLSVSLDLSSVKPGLYYLSTTHRGEASFYYPLEVVR